jgi:hypothetical protein
MPGNLAKFEQNPHNIVTLVCRACEFGARRLVQAREPATGIIMIDIPAIFDCAQAFNNFPSLIEFKR